MKNGDMSVYPVHSVYQDCGLDGNSGPVMTETIYQGLTKRELFAITALQGLLVNAGRNGLSMTECAEAAVIQAELLLTALEDKND